MLKKRHGTRAAEENKETQNQLPEHLQKVMS